MLIRIDPDSATLLFHLSSQQYQDSRRYYVARAPYRALVVLRNGLDLQAIRGQVVDVRVGWDVGQPGFCRADCEGLRQSKITIYRIVAAGRAEADLSALIRTAPRDA